MDFESLTLEDAELTLTFGSDNTVWQTNFRLPQSWRRMLYQHLLKGAVYALSNVEEKATEEHVKEYYGDFLEFLTDDFIDETQTCFAHSVEGPSILKAH